MELVLRQSEPSPAVYPEQGAEKREFMLRQAQHERKIFNHFKLLTVRPEVLEG
jgi:hypothetical protein